MRTTSTSWPRRWRAWPWRSSWGGLSYFTEPASVASEAVVSEQSVSDGVDGDGRIFFCLNLIASLTARPRGAFAQTGPVSSRGDERVVARAPARPRRRLEVALVIGVLRRGDLSDAAARSPSRLTLTRFVGGGVAGARRAGVRRAGLAARRASSAAAALATARSASSAERKSASAPSARSFSTMAAILRSSAGSRPKFASQLRSAHRVLRRDRYCRRFLPQVLATTGCAGVQRMPPRRCSDLSGAKRRGWDAGSTAIDETQMRRRARGCR